MTNTAEVFNRKKAEEWLIDDDVNHVMDGDGIELLRDYLTSGFKGYSNLSDSEIKVKYFLRRKNG